MEEKELELWAEKELRKSGTPPKVSCEMCRGGGRCQEPSGNIVNCPMCKGKGHRDNKAFLMDMRRDDLNRATKRVPND